MMIKIYKPLTLLALLIILAGCTKIKYQQDPLNYYPKVATAKDSILPDGSVRVTGELISEGSGQLYYVGFCMDTAPHPQMHFNQLLTDTLNGSSFTATYRHLDALKRYYVRAFAANEYGYAYGDDIVVENAGPDTSMIACHPGANILMTEGGGYTSKTENLFHIEALDPMTHEVNMSSNSMTLRLQFGKTPTSGKYTIWQNPSIGSDEVEVLFSESNWGAYFVKNGGTLYVQQIDATRIRVWICNQEVDLGNFITTSFTTK
jgi:hypothetical protein